MALALDRFPKNGVGRVGQRQSVEQTGDPFAHSGVYLAARNEISSVPKELRCTPQTLDLTLVKLRTSSFKRSAIGPTDDLRLVLPEFLREVLYC
jgi:hypothetical protein